MVELLAQVQVLPAASAETGLIELIKAVGLAGGLLVIILIWLTRSLIPRLQDEATSARKEFLEALDRTEKRHEAAIDRLVAAIDRDRRANEVAHREFDSRLDDIERNVDVKRLDGKGRPTREPA